MSLEELKAQYSAGASALEQIVTLADLGVDVDEYASRGKIANSGSLWLIDVQKFAGLVGIEFGLGENGLYQFKIPNSWEHEVETKHLRLADDMTTTKDGFPEFGPMTRTVGRVFDGYGRPYFYHRDYLDGGEHLNYTELYMEPRLGFGEEWGDESVVMNFGERSRDNTIPPLLSREVFYGRHGKEVFKRSRRWSEEHQGMWDVVCANFGTHPLMYRGEKGEKDLWQAYNSLRRDVAGNRKYQLGELQI